MIQTFSFKVYCQNHSSDLQMSPIFQRNSSIIKVVSCTVKIKIRQKKSKFVLYFSPSLISVKQIPSKFRSQKLNINFQYQSLLWNIKIVFPFSASSSCVAKFLVKSNTIIFFANGQNVKKTQAFSIKIHCQFILSRFIFSVKFYISFKNPFFQYLSKCQE